VVSFVLRGASVYPYFSGLPIDLQVMVLEPSIAKDHALPSEAGGSEECSLRVGFVTEDYIHYFGDLTYLVRRAIHIVHQYGARDTPSTNAFHMNKVFIYEVARSSGVQKYLDGMYFTGVGGANLYRKDDGHSTSIKGVGGELFG